MIVIVDGEKVTTPCMVGRRINGSETFLRHAEGEIFINGKGDPTISHLEFTLIETKGKLFLIGLGSKNGVMINGVRMPAGEPHLINKTTEVHIGNSIIPIKIV